MTLRKTAALVAATAVALLLAAAPAGAALPSNWDKGFNFTTWWHDTLATSASQDSMNMMVGTHANAIAIVATWYQQTATSTTMAPDGRTPDDSGVTTAIARAKARGLKVMVVPHVDSNDGVWRGQFAPTSASTWFANYQKMLLHYADLAQAAGAAQLSVGTEFKSLSGPAYAGNWKSLIAQVRKHFKGTLTYSANHDEYNNINWWSSLDIIGVSAYFPLAADTNDMTVADIVRNWQWYYIPALQQISQTYGRPVEFTELGYPSTTGALYRPNQVGTIYNDVQQNAGYEAFFEAFQSLSWFRGAYMWNWDGGWTGSGGIGDLSHLVQNKPAQTTITTWFAG